jgi:hypothetical protein
MPVRTPIPLLIVLFPLPGHDPDIYLIPSIFFLFFLIFHFLIFIPVFFILIIVFTLFIFILTCFFIFIFTRFFIILFFVVVVAIEHTMVIIIVIDEAVDFREVIVRVHNAAGRDHEQIIVGGIEG